MRTLWSGKADVLRATEVQNDLGNARVLDSGTFLGHGSCSSLCAQQAVSVLTAATSSSATPGLPVEQAAEGEERGPCGCRGQGKSREGAARGDPTGGPHGAQVSGCTTGCRGTPSTPPASE